MKLPILLMSLFLGSNLYSPNFTIVNNKFFTGSKKRILTGNTRIVPVGTVYLVIDKSDYELNVYDDRGWFATYPVVFGNNSLDDKRMEGDRCTPEGVFRVISKKFHDKWDRFMALDYPTKESYEKFKLRKMRGEIPTDAKIGGGVGIHGTWPHDDYIIDRYKNWTMGCISMKNEDIEDIYSYLPIGTKVIIRK
jgi:murein L,D-transpeptidase YafK